MSTRSAAGGSRPPGAIRPSRCRVQPSSPSPRLNTSKRRDDDAFPEPSNTIWSFRPPSADSSPGSSAGQIIGLCNWQSSRTTAPAPSPHSTVAAIVPNIAPGTTTWPNTR